MEAINLYVWGLTFDEAEDGDPETAARESCEADLGTAENCIVVDVSGRILLNTTSAEIGKVWAS